MCTSRYQLMYHDRPVEVQINESHELVLLLDGIPRKRRNRDDVSCVYVWTNIELRWEEHHFIEARWWPESGRVNVTVNGRTLLEEQHPAGDRRP